MARKSSGSFVCPFCSRIISTYVPKGGDGSACLFVKHNLPPTVEAPMTPTDECPSRHRTIDFATLTRGDATELGHPAPEYNVLGEGEPAAQ